MTRRVALCGRRTNSDQKKRGYIMRTRLAFLASAAALIAATPASAAVSFFGGATGPLPGETTIATFEPGSTAGVVESATVKFLNADSGDGMRPAFGSTGRFLSVLAGGDVTINALTPWNTLSFNYGSADAYNTLTVFFNGGASSQSFTGSQLIGGLANGNTASTATNGLVYLYGFTGGITGIRLQSSQNSFEIDNLRINAVPEPGTWAMMLLGFGAVGYAMRRRKPVAVPQVA